MCSKQHFKTNQCTNVIKSLFTLQWLKYKVWQLVRSLSLAKMEAVLQSKYGKKLEYLEKAHLPNLVTQRLTITCVNTGNWTQVTLVRGKMINLWASWNGSTIERFTKNSWVLKCYTNVYLIPILCTSLEQFWKDRGKCFASYIALQQGSFKWAYLLFADQNLHVEMTRAQLMAYVSGNLLSGSPTVPCQCRILLLVTVYSQLSLIWKYILFSYKYTKTNTDNVANMYK